MKQGIHPNYYTDAVVTCACGNKFTTGSTQQNIRVEICAACHPFFTGQQKFVDTLGQVERFQKKAKESEAKREVKQQIIQNRAQKTPKSSDRLSLKDMLMQTRKNLAS